MGSGVIAWAHEGGRVLGIHPTRAYSHAHWELGLVARAQRVFKAFLAFLKRFLAY